MNVKPELAKRSSSSMKEFDHVDFDSDDENFSVIASMDAIEIDNYNAEKEAKKMAMKMAKMKTVISPDLSEANTKQTADPIVAMNFDDIQTPHSGHKRKHVKTGNPKGGFRKSKNRKKAEYYIATVRSQQMYEQSADVIKAKCMTAIKKFSDSELTDLLSELQKIEQTSVETSHTDAINIIADARGDTKTFYEEISTKSGVDLDELISQNEHHVRQTEAYLDDLHDRNKVLQYMLEERNTSKKARVLFRMCILTTLVDASDEI